MRAGSAAGPAFCLELGSLKTCENLEEDEVAVFVRLAFFVGLDDGGGGEGEGEKSSLAEEEACLRLVEIAIPVSSPSRLCRDLRLRAVTMMMYAANLSRIVCKGQEMCSCKKKKSNNNHTIFRA